MTHDGPLKVNAESALKGKGKVKKINYLKPTKCHDGLLKVNAESAKARLEERRQQGVLRQRLEREKQAIFFFKKFCFLYLPFSVKPAIRFFKDFRKLEKNYH